MRRKTENRIKGRVDGVQRHKCGLYVGCVSARSNMQIKRLATKNHLMVNCVKL